MFFFVGVEAGGRACFFFFRIDGIGISLACKHFYRESLAYSIQRADYLSAFFLISKLAFVGGAGL